MTAERRRLDEDARRQTNWKRWGPYLSERAWGTVREDYSATGDAWDYFPHDHARARAYRWNEDGLAGLCDRRQRVCLALAMWNGRDPILKERLFGLSGSEGNHGEDVKEYYYYLDSTPTHSYMRYLYKYPQDPYPYERLIAASRGRTRDEAEFELHETGIFDGNRYFDVFVEYAKADPEDILMQITVLNRGDAPAVIHLLPTLWFRNTWSWTPDAPKPVLARENSRTEPSPAILRLDEPTLGTRWAYCDGNPTLLFTENETNTVRLFGTPGPQYAKDGIHAAVVGGRMDAVNPAGTGTKAAAHYTIELPAHSRHRIRLRFAPVSPEQIGGDWLGDDFDEVIKDRRQEANEFYATVIPDTLSKDEGAVMRQALAGLLWSKQYYNYDVRTWLAGDPGAPPPAARLTGRNATWRHLYNADVVSMPDKWEFPWYAAWDLAFHCVPFALVDAEFAKQQLVLLLREWYMHPNGMLPAYEWALGDVNPPVHAWAAWRVYKMDKRRSGVGDTVFLERVFQKLLINFTWWVNRKDEQDKNVFQGGFLGLDNVGVFDRSQALPTGGHLEQSDGTSWMAMYCLNMLAMAIELSDGNAAYEDMASKFLEHFLYIAHAMGHRVGDSDEVSLWDDVDGFYYDVLHLPNGRLVPLKIRSVVGLIPLLAIETLEPERLDRMRDFSKRLDWFVAHRADLTSGVASMIEPGRGARRLLSVVSPDQLRRVLRIMLDETEFLSPFGIRSLSKLHEEAPYELLIRDTLYRVAYEPGESRTPVFGGNSNWRGPVWLPINFLIIEALQKFHHYLGNDFTVECPTGSFTYLTLDQVAAELGRRLSTLFLRDGAGERPVNAGVKMFNHDPHWRDYVWFYEHFNGNTGAGVGASHQTGWTALIAKLLQQQGQKSQGPATPTMLWDWGADTPPKPPGP